MNKSSDLITWLLSKKLPYGWHRIGAEKVIFGAETNNSFHVRGRMADVWFAWGSETVEVGAETIEIGAETVKFGAEMDNIFS